MTHTFYCMWCGHELDTVEIREASGSEEIRSIFSRQETWSEPPLIDKECPRCKKHTRTTCEGGDENHFAITTYSRGPLYCQFSTNPELVKELDEAEEAANDDAATAADWEKRDALIVRGQKENLRFCALADGHEEPHRDHKGAIETIN